MQAGRKFISRQCIDGTMPRHPAHAGKGRAYDLHAKMRLSTAIELSMVPTFDVVVTGMQMAFIDDLQRRRCQRRFDLVGQ